MICLISAAQNMQRMMHFLFSKLITQKELVALLPINEMWNQQAFKNYISYIQENIHSRVDPHSTHNCDACNHRVG